MVLLVEWACGWMWGIRTVCCVHDVVEVVDCDAAVFSCFAGDTAELVFAVAAWFLSASSREDTG